MSVMELSKNHYQYIANSLYRIGVQFSNLMPFYETRVTFGAHQASEREKKIFHFINKLQKFNLESYDVKYPSQADSEYEPDFVTHIMPLNGDLEPCQFLKALECIHYQCSGSDNFEHSPEKKVLESIMNEAKDLIVSELPEYKSAKWGIE